MYNSDSTVGRATNGTFSVRLGTEKLEKITVFSQMITLRTTYIYYVFFFVIIRTKM